MKTAVIGFPRIGALRELKFSSEKYFRNEITEEDLIDLTLYEGIGKVKYFMLMKLLFGESNVRFDYKINSDNNSVGLTQIRFKYLSNKEKQLFNKYNITKESLVNNPAKAAMATIIKLACNYKDSGNNIDKAVQRWNQKPSYLQQVNKNASRFNLYEQY